MRALLTVLLVAFCGVSFAQQAGNVAPGAYEISSEKKQLIRELIDLSGGTGMVTTVTDQIVDGMLHSIKQQPNRDVPPRVDDIIAEEVKAAVRDALSDGGSFYKRMYPIYDRHFSYAELKKLAEWYDTPLGQKTARSMPQIMQESVQAGQMWAQQELIPVIQRRLRQRFQAEGLAQ